MERINFWKFALGLGILAFIKSASFSFLGINLFDDGESH
jgi:hypothetical protein